MEWIVVNCDIPDIKKKGVESLPTIDAYLHQDKFIISLKYLVAGALR